MVDARFFKNHGPFSLGELVERTGCRLSENASPDLMLHDVAPLDRATAQDISFLDNPKYVDSFRHCQAGACFVREKYVSHAPENVALLISSDPYRAYALAAQAFYPLCSSDQHIAPSAHIAESATTGSGASIAEGVVIAEHVTIGKGCIIGANSVIHEGVEIGAHTRIGALSSISHSVIGQHCILHRGVHIGQDGFGFAMSREGHVKVPQLGRVIIEDHVEIGAGTCIDRGTGPDTSIGMGTKIDNLVQIGHNVTIGKGAVIVAQTGIAGSSRIGDGAILGGQVGIAGHLRIGAGARVAAQSGVMHDVPPGASMGGAPALPIKEWHRQTIALGKLSKPAKRNEEQKEKKDKKVS